VRLSADDEGVPAQILKFDLAGYTMAASFNDLPQDTADMTVEYLVHYDVKSLVLESSHSYVTFFKSRFAR
jgi:hypothetical protein